MTHIEVFAPQETPQIIEITESEPIRDNAKEAARYREEAKAPGLSEMDIWAKNNTADYLAKLALEDRVREYSGHKPPSPR